MHQRKPAFDVMKGIAVLLMVWEHCNLHMLPYEHAIIYSFHMPLFFLLGGYFAKDVFSFDGFGNITKKNAKRLLLPYAVTFILLILWGFLQSILKHEWSLVARYVITLFWASGDVLEYTSGFVTAGPTWFLIALFWTREFFHCIQVLANKLSTKYREIIVIGICLILSLLAKEIYPIVQPLPFGILPGITALIFYAIGWFVRKYTIPWYIFVISTICWPLSICFGGIELYGCQFSFPLDLIGACGATYVIYKFCDALCTFNNKFNLLQNSPYFLKWCGLNSLSILCMHTFETHSGILWSFKCRLPFEMSADAMMWARIIAALLFAWFIMNTPILKNAYK